MDTVDNLMQVEEAFHELKSLYSEIIWLEDEIEQQEFYQFVDEPRAGEELALATEKAKHILRTLGEE